MLATTHVLAVAVLLQETEGLNGLIPLHDLPKPKAPILCHSWPRISGTVRKSCRRGRPVHNL